MLFINIIPSERKIDTSANIEKYAILLALQNTTIGTTVMIESVTKIVSVSQYVSPETEQTTNDSCFDMNIKLPMIEPDYIIMMNRSFTHQPKATHPRSPKLSILSSGSSLSTGCWKLGSMS